MNPSQDYAHCLFAAKVYSARTLSRVLAAIQLGKRETNCQVVVTDAGLRVVADLEDRSFQATAIVKPDIFQDYRCPATPIRFAVNLPHLLDCLGLYGVAAPTTTAQLYYPGPDRSLVVVLQEGDKATECVLRTCGADDALDMRFGAYPLSSKAVLRGEVFRDVVADFDGLVDRVKLRIAPAEAVWSGAGVAAQCRISIPSKADAFFHYECGRETESEFLLSHLLLASKGVPRDGGEKVTLRTNSEGMLSIQHQVRTADQGPTCTVEFICLPLIEDMT